MNLILCIIGYIVIAAIINIVLSLISMNVRGPDSSYRDDELNFVVSAFWPLSVPLFLFIYSGLWILNKTSEVKGDLVWFIYNKFFRKDGK